MALSSCSVRFSNIGGGSGSLPDLRDIIVVSGLKKDSVVFAEVGDIVNCLGCSLTGSTTNIVLQRNGQILELTVGSTKMKVNFRYSVKDYQTGKMVSYSFQWCAALPAAPFIHTNGKRYVPVELVCMQLGTLIVGTYSSVLTVYDFRVKKNTPSRDDNFYIVGGSWITNWSTVSSSYLAPHFKISELFSKNPSYGGYRQLKISLSLLSSLEAVRHTYRGDASLSVSCAFRSWAYNKALSGSWSRSFHMRGRAYDIDSEHSGTELYNEVYEEFCKGEKEPKHSGNSYPDGFWQTRYTASSLGASLGYEIETMPRGAKKTTWLHLQVTPGCEDQA